MHQIVIRRCPINPAVRMHAVELMSRLLTGSGLKARIEDGVVDDFSIWVDGIPMLQRSDVTLPRVEEVEAAVQNALSPGFNPEARL